VIFVLHSILVGDLQRLTLIAIVTCAHMQGGWTSKHGQHTFVIWNAKYVYIFCIQLVYPVLLLRNKICCKSSIIHKWILSHVKYHASPAEPQDAALLWRHQVRHQVRPLPTVLYFHKRRCVCLAHFNFPMIDATLFHTKIMCDVRDVRVCGGVVVMTLCVHRMWAFLSIKEIGPRFHDEVVVG
jgi:hypothetical protein